MAELTLEDVHVPTENLLGKEGRGFKICMMTLDKARLDAAAMGVGLAQGALDYALSYAKSRVTVHRKVEENLHKKAKIPDESLKTSGKTSGKILDALKQDGELTIPELAGLIGVTERSIERNVRNLQGQGRLRRIGPAKGGHWEVP